MNNYIFPFLWMRGESEDVLRNEIQKISECGIRAICVESRPHPEFCGSRWWKDMDIVLAEAKKMEMKIWILDDKHFPTGYAAGLIETKYPERKKEYIACTVADVFGSSRPLSLDVSRMLRPSIGFWEIGAEADHAERENNRILAITALRFTEQNRFASDVIDLTGNYSGGLLNFHLPQGQWRIHVIYTTKTDGGDTAYINMIDELSASTQLEGVYEAHFEHYADEFGKTIAGFFSDEPQFGNIRDVVYETALGRKKMPLPWSKELQDIYIGSFGEEYKKQLPFLFAECEEKEHVAACRYFYMDNISRLYEKNFSRKIGSWCEEHGVEYIGHVVEDNSIHSKLGMGAGHWFRAMAGQDMAGIDIISGQYYFGAPVQERRQMLDCDGEFYHYALGKLGASAGHLDPKKKGRTMCELFGAYGWNLGVRNMKYMLDHLLCKGINHLVPHAFSMAEYPDHDCPPHFYAGGKNLQFPWFAELMKYANRMCGLLNGGKHVAEIAILYDGEGDWIGNYMPMQKVCRILTEHQTEFDIVALDMLKNPNAYKGSLDPDGLRINGMLFRLLLIPHMEYIPKDLADFIDSAKGKLPIYFVGGRPKAILGEKEPFNGGGEAELSDLMDLAEIKNAESVRIDRMFSSLNVYRYQKDRQIVMLQNEDPDHAWCGEIYIPFKNEAMVWDAWNNTYVDIACRKDGNGIRVYLDLESGQSCVLMEKLDSLTDGTYESTKMEREECSSVLDLSRGWEMQKVSAIEYPNYTEAVFLDELRAISDTEENFAGIIRYKKSFYWTKEVKKACILVENVYELMRVYVNGIEVGMSIVPPYQMAVEEYLKTGENELLIEVATSLGRDQRNYPQPPFDFFHEAMEPTGIYGRVELRYKEE